MQITELINQCKHLQQRFCGIFPANLAFNTKLKRDNTFMIVNASDSGQPGTHWLLFAQAGGRFFCRSSWTKPIQLSTCIKKNMDDLSMRETKY